MHPPRIGQVWFAIPMALLVSACGGGGASTTPPTPAPTYAVGGAVAGLGAGKTFVLRNNAGNDLSIDANGAFAFTTPVASAAVYAVTVATQPAGQTCTVANAGGTVVNADVTDVAVNCVGLDTAAPSVPASLAASAMSASQVGLTWIASTDNVAVTGYRLERCQGAGCTGFAQIAAAAGAAHSDSGLAANTSYRYRVRAADAAGNLSAYSSIATATTAPPAPPGSVAAFPGAEGAGAVSVGGRGGAIYKVTSLADSGPGTLRDCAETRSGPRTCVFTVGGIVRLQTTLWIDKPFLTVAGQTAPGGGILITNADGAVIGSLVGIATHNVIWQYTRLRNQWRSACQDSNGSECGGLFAVNADAHTVIADHNSLSWNQDEGFGIWRGSSSSPDLKNVTISMNLIAEGLASHSTGFIAGGSTSAMSARVFDIDFHHNLVMNNNHRNPLLKIRSARVVNNLFYNHRFYSSQVGGGGEFDLIGNVYKRGPMTSVARHEIQAFASIGADAFEGEPSIYLSGNVGWHQSDAATDQWLMTSRVTGENGTQNGAIPEAWKRRSALPGSARPITIDAAADIAAADGRVVPTVGASRRLTCAGAWVANRDAADTRLISQYLTDTGISQLPTDENTYGGMPAIAAGAPCADADNDGLPDEWERLEFGHLDQGPNGDADGDGYTNLEAYLHGL